YVVGKTAENDAGIE
ncbi:MAG: hypothetical protein EZS28_026531, partial [Streblomastix strix]